MNNETTQLADYLGQMIRQATVETIRHIVGEEAASNAAHSPRSIPLPGGDTEPADPEPDAPAWPTAPHVWWDGEVWTLDSEGAYEGPGDYWEECHMRDGLTSEIRDKARRFAREAVPVVMVPTEAWEAWLNALPDPANDADDDLVQAVDSLAQEVAR